MWCRQRRQETFVVCNLASLTLGRLPVHNLEYIREVVRTAVRALDNVIDLNFYPIPYAEITNRNYRAIGLGVSGYHHMLAKNQIKWESKEHLTFVDRLFEELNYAAIEASSDYAAEKGSYRYFKGSDWETGAYFEKRGYDSEKMAEVKRKSKETGNEECISSGGCSNQLDFYYFRDDSRSRSGDEEVFSGGEKRGDASSDSAGVEYGDVLVL